MTTGVVFLPYPAATNCRTRRADRRHDVALAAVIAGKPRDDEVATDVWWLLAECLGYSVTLRREAALCRDLGSSDFCLTMTQARFTARKALDELNQPSVNERVRAADDPTRRSPGRGPLLRLTVQDLAGLIVSHRATSQAEVRRAIHAHLDALWILDHPASRA